MQPGALRFRCRCMQHCHFSLLPSLRQLLCDSVAYSELHKNSSTQICDTYKDLLGNGLESTLTSARRSMTTAAMLLARRPILAIYPQAEMSMTGTSAALEFTTHARHSQECNPVRVWTSALEGMLYDKSRPAAPAAAQPGGISLLPLRLLWLPGGSVPPAAHLPPPPLPSASQEPSPGQNPCEDVLTECA